MEFLNVTLLGGLALLGVPILVHLMMRQKPRRLPFPAFRFLRQRHLINRRQMRLQHLLLLLLRMLVLAVLCLAIAQPKLFLPRAVAGWFGLVTPRPAAAVFVFDASYSMEYQVGGLSRLDDARQRALALVRDLPAESQVCVLDTGEDGGDESDGDWIATPALARSRINGLRIRPVRAPLLRQIAKAADLLAKSDQGGEPSSRQLYAFSDRTTTSWDLAEAKRLKIPDGVQTAYIDLGVDNPSDLAIDKIELAPQVAAPGGRVKVTATIHTTGADFDANLFCQLDKEAGPASRRIKLSAGEERMVDFDLTVPALARSAAAPEGVVTELHQVVVKFSTPDDRPFKDDLAHDNVRYATFQVRDDPKRQGRQVLTLADDPKAARTWAVAFQAYLKYNPFEGFRCDVRTTDEAAKIGLKELQPYRVVCLFQTAKPLPEPFWNALEEYVRGGGGLAIAPPVEDLSPIQLQGWNAVAEAHHLLPARLRTLTGPPEGEYVYWDDFDPRQPLTRPFSEWKRGANPDFASEQLKPYVNRYWQVEPLKDEAVVVGSYTDGQKSPALVERSLGDGRVVEFTTTLDRRQLADNRDWNNFYFGSFGMVLINEVCKYLAGDESAEEFNFLCGAPVVLPLQAAAPRGVYRLDAPDPDLTESERSLTVAKADVSLEIRAASAPGQYTLFDPGHNRFAAFSLNVAPDECRLDRLPREEIETALGKGSVLTPETGKSLTELLRERGRSAAATEPPAAMVDLLPLLMVLTLLFLTFEGLLANTFYKRPSSAAGEPEPERIA